MPKVVVIGSLNMDLIVRAERRPATGETVMGSDFHVLPGGKGLNQAVAAARLGADTHMVGRVGDDDFGRRLRAFIAAERVGDAHVHASPGVATGVAVITLVDGDNTIVVASGANMLVTSGDVDALPVSQSDICVGQFEVPMATTEAAFRRARAAGARTLLNAAPAQALPPSLLEVVDILIVNEHELTILSGATITEASTDADIADAARRLVSSGRSVIATLGARGALAVDGNGVHLVAGHKVTVVDTTGAGDCFVGALAATLAAGTALPAALERATTAAAISVQRLGAAPSMPTLAELENSRS
ncbi:ribokinase [Reyranella sp. CPCC 100927]|uniref:ribokinase n=1 Tax=Reyranella sp. CPCC 100927 TaxID=2599616 RepID=UPI0011B798C5|nr:ribokinase [Reyranella sp. CPCC 100927]TWT10554.1 ribokinase [Reyranella sp. CPCC 100927]